MKRFNRLELRELIENRIGTIIEPSRLEELENSFGGVDSFTYALKAGHFEQKITRRDFVKMPGSMLITIAGLSAILQSCATIGLIKEEGPVHYPRLPGQKIQSPEHYGLEGCMTGIWAPRYSTELALDEYKQKVGKELSFYFLPYQLRTQIPLGISDKALNNMRECAKRNVIPFITYDARMGDHAPKNATKAIYSGEYDEVIIQAAKDLKKYGEEYGGFFIRTMREMNLHGTWSWAGNPKKMKKAWKHIWNIFENEGTNEYATWVFNPYVAHNRRGIGHNYYPGDKFVDWIGFNGYNFDGPREWASPTSLSSMFAYPSRYYLDKHADKPQQICETGMDNLGYKPKFVTNAFNSTRLKLPGIKALSWWSENWSHSRIRNFNSKIDSSPEALEAFKKGISDPYFLGKIPYKNH